MAAAEEKSFEPVVNVQNGMETEEIEITEEKYEEMTRLVEDKANEIADLSEKLREATENNSMTSEMLLKSLEACVEYNQGTTKEILSGVKKLIPESVEAYKSFRNLLESDKTLEKYPDRVKGAHQVYKTYWDLLLETGPMLAILSSKVTTVINCINEYNEENNDTKSDDIDIESIVDDITECVNSLSAWQKQALEINKFAVKWGELAKLAQDEEIAWREIHNKNKKVMKEEFSLWKRFLSGVNSIKNAASDMWSMATNFTLAEVGHGIVRVPWLLVVCPVGIGYGLYKAYNNYKESQRGFVAAQKTAKNMEYVANVMLNIGNDAQEISSALRKLQESMNMDINNGDSNDDNNVVSLTSSCSDMERGLRKLAKHKKRGKLDKFYEKLDSINKSLNKIQISMKLFKKECQDCVLTIQKSRDNIIQLQKERLGK